MEAAARTTAELDPIAVNEFQMSLRGNLFTPDSTDYDSVRRVYNAMIDRHPRLIAQCANVADVISAVDFARDNEMLVSIRGGGHNVAGLALCDEGLVIDLTRMKGIRVDPDARTARVEGGCTWGDVDHATHAFGLATPSGTISTTGVAGLTLGGGLGHLTRAYGLTCDNLLAADVVTADGRLVKASESENPDLYWALRGGGGNFGVVTSFEFRLHPVDMVLGGPIFYPIELTADLLRFYRDFMKSAPDNLGAFFGFHYGPVMPFIPAHLQGIVMAVIVVCYSGPVEQGEDAIKSLREFGPPLLDLAAPMPYPAMQKSFDPLLPPGMMHYWRSDFANGISDEAILIHTEFGPRLPTLTSTMHLYPIDGAAHRVGRNDTAFSYRDADFSYNIVGTCTDPVNVEPSKAWVREYWSALRPLSAGAAYVNFLMDEGQDRIRAAYRDNYDRLVEVKNKYDPNNLFRVNQNIKPST